VVEDDGDPPVYTGIDGTPANEEDWTLEALGNWSAYVRKTGGSTTLNQTRLHNKVNEIDDDDYHLPGDPIDEGAITEGGWQAVWVVPGYDAAGNMTAGPKPGAETTKHCYQYDAWNRLRRVFVDGDSDGVWDNEQTDTLVAEYRYDALNRRIAKIQPAARE
jgi:hypothetical protein